MLARGYFHTVELSHSLRSLVGTSIRSSFLTRYARSWVLPHCRAFSLATLARGYFRTVELSHSLRSLVGTSTHLIFGKKKFHSEKSKKNLRQSHGKIPS